jgi:hypothetical protein
MVILGNVVLGVLCLSTFRRFVRGKGGSLAGDKYGAVSLFSCSLVPNLASRQPWKLLNI